MRGGDCLENRERHQLGVELCLVRETCLACSDCLYTVYIAARLQPVVRSPQGRLANHISHSVHINVQALYPNIYIYELFVCWLCVLAKGVYKVLYQNFGSALKILTHCTFLAFSMVSHSSELSQNRAVRGFLSLAIFRYKGPFGVNNGFLLMPKHPLYRFTCITVGPRCQYEQVASSCLPRTSPASDVSEVDASTWSKLMHNKDFFYYFN